MSKFSQILISFVILVIAILIFVYYNGRPGTGEIQEVKSEVTTLPFDSTAYAGSGMVGFDQYGAGYNSITDQQCAQCMDFEWSDRANILVRTPAPSALYESKQITNTYELKNELGVSVAASIKYGSVKASGSYSYFNSKGVSRYSSYLIIREKVVKEKIAFKRPVVQTKFIRMAKNDFPNFVTQCGDKYIHGATLGGSLLVIVEISSSNEKEYQSNQAKLNASASGMFVKASVSSALDKVFQELKSYNSIRISLIREGGVEEIPSIDSLQAYSQKFVTFVNKNPTVIETELREYSPILGSDVATKFSRLRNLTYALRTMEATADRYMENKWNLLYIRNNLSQFPDSVDRIYPDLWDTNEGHIAKINKVADSLSDVYLKAPYLKVPVLSKPLKIGLLRSGSNLSNAEPPKVVDTGWKEYDVTQSPEQIIGTIPAGTRGARLLITGGMAVGSPDNCMDVITARKSGVYPVVSVIVRDKNTKIPLYNQLVTSNSVDLPFSNAEVSIVGSLTYGVPRANYRPCSDVSQRLKAAISSY